MIWKFSKKFTVFLGFFFVFLSFTLETVIYDEQKCQVVRLCTAVTLTTGTLLAKYPFFNSLIQKLRESEQKCGLRTLVLVMIQVPYATSVALR